MNRMAMGLAVGAGYVLGRTKKAKFAFAVGTMVAGKKLNLSPKALGSLVTQQLENNPQFKEIGDQLRQDLRGVGKAATGSLLNRQLEGLADRLHDRTLDVQDRIAGVVPDKAKGAAKDEDEDDDPDAEVDEDDDPDAELDEDDDDPDAEAEADAESEPSGRRGRAAAKTGTRTAAKKTAARKTAAKKTAAKKAPAKKTARKTAEKTAQKPARKAAQKKTSSAARTGGRAKGGRDHG
ncbi:DNA primase [Streptomyces huasconensis]|uniref:DNA primase n=2 Tax=Streptomyces TaxID=1883 RepID=UPI001E5BF9A6|nr:MULTISPECIES: DNA primase [Streptomyces]UFQ19182.1 DNA primase [Streptomyces huasconensis]WCL88802.1 DNA primase [Streptomyces sp. JCM 35825]